MTGRSAPTLHGTAVLVGPDGVLIRGVPGSGKSTLGLTLVERRMAAGGFAAFVADDQVELFAAGGRLLARRPVRIAGLLEVRGRGIIPVASEAVAVVRLVVDLVPAETVARMPIEGSDETVIEGIPLPRRILPALASWLAAAAVERALRDEDRLVHHGLVP